MQNSLARFPGLLLAKFAAIGRWGGIARFVTLLMAVALPGLVMAPAATGQTAVPTADVLLARTAGYAPPTLPGQSATLLGDGRWLLMGGLEGGRVLKTVQTYDASTGETSVLPAVLATGRAYHTATVLPDGTVLVLGGESAAGVPMRSAERFDPIAERFITVSNIAVLVRSRHTATLLTDGRLVIAGGTSAARAPMAEIEIVDGTSLAIAPLAPRLVAARSGQQARLLGSGAVLISGGLPNGSTSPPAEVFDPAALLSVRLPDVSPSLLPSAPYAEIDPAVAAFVPVSGTSNVPLNARFAVRFNKPLNPDSLSFENISLTGLGARVPFKLVVAEGGMLVFATPSQLLKSASRYALWVQGGADESGRALGQVSAGYLTVGASTAAVTSTTGSASAGSTGATTGTASTASTSANLTPVAAAAGTWVEVANSLLRSVVPPSAMSTKLYGSPQAVMTAWSGGDFDTTRRQLLVWGGGHGDYAGNEVYAFSIDTLKWSRLTDPSLVTPPDVRIPGQINPANAYYPDGRPRSRHTYGYVAYVPSLDRFCSMGGNGFFITGQTGTDNIDCFSPATKTWEYRGKTAGHGHALSAYDTVTKTVWTMGNLDAAYLTQWNPATGVSEIRSGFDAVLQYTLSSMNAVIDPKRRKFVIVGNGQVHLFDIGASGKLTRAPLATTGATAILGARAPGLLYDPVSDRIVAWGGGTDLFSLNLDTAQWTRLAATSDSVDPGLATANGTFGRFRYVPSKDAYIAVSSIDDNVFFYKPVRASTTATTSTAPAVTAPGDPGPGAAPPVAPLPTPGTAFSIPVVLSDGAYSAARNNVPVTFGHVFRKGDIPSSLSLLAKTRAGVALETQVDVKARHADGSMRHAIITVLLPTQTAAATDIVLTTRPVPAAGAPLATSALLARSSDLGTVRLNIGGVVYTANVNGAIAAVTDRWLDGPLVTEWRVPVVPVDAAGVRHPHLQVIFDVRAYRGMQYVRTDFTIEHPWAFEPGTKPYAYSATLTLGGKTVYSKSAMTHYPQARWRKVYWLADDPRLIAKYEIGYLLATKAVPNYDRAVVPLRAAMISELNFTTPRSEPLMAGFIDDYMPGVGNHHDLGILPPAAAMYVLSMDDLARLNMMRSGDLFGSWSVHYRDRAAGRMLSVLDYPYASTTTYRLDTYNPVRKAYEQVEFGNCMAQANAPCRPVLSQENGAHQPTQSYMPYLVTGDRYYLEELQFWANFNIIDQTPAYRDFEKGHYRRNQVRAMGWAMRTAGQAAYITPDGDPMKAYFTANVLNNLAYIDQTAYALYPAFRDLGVIDGPVVPVYNNGTGLAPWQDDVYTQALGYLVSDLGFSQGASAFAKKAKFAIGRMSAPGYCWILASSYNLNYKTTSTADPLKSMADVYRLNFSGWTTSDGKKLVDLPCGGAEMSAFLNKYNLEVNKTTTNLLPGEMVGYSDSYNGYPMHMQPVLSYAVDQGVPGSAAAWTTFDSRARKPATAGTAYGALSSSPHFAIRPRQ